MQSFEVIIYFFTKTKTFSTTNNIVTTFIPETYSTKNVGCSSKSWLDNNLFYNFTSQETDQK